LDESEPVGIMDRRNDELYTAISEARRLVVRAGDIALSMGRTSIEHDLFAIHQELYRIATSVYERKRLNQLKIDLDASASSDRADDAKAGSRPQRPARQRPAG